MKYFFGIFVFFAVFTLIPIRFVAAQDNQDIQEGGATWYKSDTLDLSASHAKLPLGTKLRVINLDNNKEVTVSVTNRIPSNGSRILDLSAEAARILAMNETGETPIRYEVMRQTAMSIFAVPPAEVSTDDSVSDDPLSIDDPVVAAEVPVTDPLLDDPFSVSNDPVTAADSSSGDNGGTETTAAEPDTIASTETADEVSANNTEAVPEPQITGSSVKPVSESVPPADVPKITAVEESVLDTDESGITTEEEPSTAEAPTVTIVPSEPRPPVRTKVPSSVSDVQIIEPTIRSSAAKSSTAPAQIPVPTVTTTAIPENMTIRVIIDVNGQEYEVKVPSAATQKPVSTPPVRAAAPSRTRSSIPPAVSAPVRSNAPAAKIVPQIPDSRSRKMYRVQVGAFSSTTFAQECYNKLKSAGFSPAFERNGRIYRVVISGARAGEITGIARQLGSLGFAEAWIREEN